MKKNNKLVLCICLVAVAVLSVVLVLVLGNIGGTTDNKTPPEYTWEEYQALTLEEKDAFYSWFESQSAFEAWIDSVKPVEEEIEIPSWDESKRLPSEYTWEEYQALTFEEKDAFYLWFESQSAFETWMDSVKPVEEEIEIPSWNKSDKLPNEYTWAEYQELSAEERDAFFLWFESQSAFEAWKDSVKPVEEKVETPSWNKSNKLPNEYTWAEYQALSGEEQEAFYNWFNSTREFEAWMESVKPAEEKEPEPAWDKPGKKPNQYTWEEYQALTYEEQHAFYLWFGSEEAFEAWAESVKPAEEKEPEPTWDKPGKKPNEYTWEEYQALTPQEQDAFYLWFGSMADFEAWMDSVKPTEEKEPEPAWDKPGKNPDEYTWEEYQALTPQEQDAFYLWFGSLEAFEAWMENAEGQNSN